MSTPIQVIRTYAPQFGLDPKAVLAYALTQGGTSWGAVGDQGTSFGPFQAHIGGAAGRRSPVQAASWANSPTGLIEMMAMMARAGARGRSGPEAAAYIVGPSFGRGADPAGDMAKARAAYPRAAALMGGGALEGVSAPPVSTTSPTPFSRENGQARQQLGLALMDAIGKKRVSALSDVFAQYRGLQDQAAAATQGAAPVEMPSVEPVPAVVQTAAAPGQLAAAVGSIASRFGLSVTSGYRSVAKQAQLYAGRSGPGTVAAPGKSYHNSGRAIDVSPSSAALRFLAYAHAHPEQFTEVFYDPAGWYIKNGRIVKGAIGGHSDHVHIAV